MAKSRNNGPVVSSSNPLDAVMSSKIAPTELTRKAAMKVLKKVIKAQRGAKARTITAAEFAVAFDVERRKAEKRGALKGFIDFLDDARDASMVLVLKYDPDGGWLSGSDILNRAYVAIGAVPDPVRDAEVRYELRKRAEKVAKKRAKRKARTGAAAAA